ncbi:MAG: FeoA family protein [Actinomycetota bacterium]|nr:FeoA family protein [Actinomycetota bacterium]
MLAEMKIGEKGLVTKIDGGSGVERRLEALGIRKGSRVTKAGSMLLKGPVVVRVDGCQLALGYGVAKKIMVEVEE